MTFELWVSRSTMICTTVTFVFTALFTLIRSKGAVAAKCYLWMLGLTALVAGMALVFERVKTGGIAWGFLAPVLIAVPPAIQFVAAGRKGAAVGVLAVAFVVTFIGFGAAIGNMM